MRRVLALTVISVLLAFASPALAEGPGERLKSATVGMLEVLQARELRDPARFDERRNLIRTTVNGFFDWQELSRQVLSRHWELLTPHERDEFTALYGDIVRRSYVTMISTSYRGEEISLVLLDETIDGDRAAVRAELVSKSNVVPITFRFIEHETGWKVYDVVIDGISVLSNSRSQIGRLLQRFGYAGMMTMLTSKQNELLAQESQRDTKISRANSN